MTTLGPERRRSALQAVLSSDVTRFRAFGGAAVVLSLTVLGVLTLDGGGPRALVTPGPLARPHRELACASCHGEERGGSTTRACSGCHGPHPSVRPAHATLAGTGELTCGTCHAVHRAESGLAFEANGRISHYGSGFERALEGSAPGDPSAGPNASPVFVPLAHRAACASCHDLERATDPAWACFSGRERGAPGAFSLCFDEHRRPAQASAARAAERDAAVERARAIATRLPPEPRARLFSASATLAVGALAAGFFVAFARRRTSRAQRPRSLPLAVPGPGVRRLPTIDAMRCLGCHACVDACPYDVLAMARYVAVVSRPDQCCGAGSCLVACPNGSLLLSEGPAPSDAPRIGARLESLERPGIFLAGDVSGGSLIRIALEQGVSVARAVAEDLAHAELHEPSGGEGSLVDLVVIGAGPAGLAAGLEAQRRGLGVLVLEQATIAESIHRYSRDKLVLDAQPGGEGSLPLWIGDCKKEELVRRWLREVRYRGLDVREGARVMGVEGGPWRAFQIRAVRPDGSAFSILARRVVVATGRRGSPRKLDAAVPEPAQGRVHYELSDARAFAGSRVMVVGLGDVAMETALALALQPGTSVTLVHRGSGFSRGRQKNVEQIGRLVAEGRIGLLLDARVKTIGLERVVVEAEGRERRIPYDAIFVHIGVDAARGLPFLSPESHSA